MKISISNELIVNAFASARTMEEAYKEVLPELEINTDFDFDINEIKPIIRKWGSVYVENNSLILDINDNLIIDVMDVGTNMYAKFAPILGVARSMIPMLKNYFRDASTAFVPVAKKYLEDYFYTVEEVKFPGVKVGYMVLKKNCNGGKWTIVEDRICVDDKMQKMSKSTLRNFQKEVITTNVSDFNEAVEKGEREPVYMIPNEDATYALDLLNDKFKVAMDTVDNTNEATEYAIAIVDDGNVKSGYVFLTKIDNKWIADLDLSDIQLEDSWLNREPEDRFNLCAQLIDNIEFRSNNEGFKAGLDITRFTDRDDAIKTASDYMKRKLNAENGDTIHIQ